MEKNPRRRTKEKVYNNMKKWILDIKEDSDSGDCILTFPPDLLEEAGWKEGDTLEWIDLKDGSWQLIKKNV